MPDGGGYHFEQAEQHWHCEDGEIDALRAFLNQQLEGEGNYRLVRDGTTLASIIAQLEDGALAAEDIAALLASGVTADIARILATSSKGLLLTETVELLRRRQQLDELRAIVENPRSTERDIHAQLRTMGWVFGGRYVGEARRQQLTAEDILDIPLLRPDGRLHVVELKKANVTDFIRKHRGYPIPGRDVHEATTQAMNYLRSLDEERNTIIARFKIDPRRASATVVVGHPAFIPFTGEEITDALRTYNSHLSRIEIIHYAELIDSAARALALAGESDEAEKRPPPAEDINEQWQDSAASPWNDEPPF